MKDKTTHTFKLHDFPEHIKKQKQACNNLAINLISTYSLNYNASSFINTKQDPTFPAITSRLQNRYKVQTETGSVNEIQCIVPHVTR